MELHDFLEARIAEDEEVATAASNIGGTWCVALSYGKPQDIMVEGKSGEPEDGMYVTIDHEGIMPSVDEDAAYHIARFDPARILMECKAKRAVLAAATDDVMHIPTGRSLFSNDKSLGYTRKSEGRVILEALAGAYSAHEDYDPDWAV